MNLSKLKVIFFFGAIFLAIVILYPRNFFLGYINEGSRNLTASESYYLKVLNEKPFDRSAILRLAALYEKNAEPEKATPYLKRLAEHRSGDWEVATLYLDHLGALHDQEALLTARLETARRFMKKNATDERIESLLYDAYQQALWSQRYEIAYDILEDLKKVARHPRDFFEEEENLDRALKNTPRLIRHLQDKIASDPHNIDLRQDLVEIYTVNDRFEEALALIDEGLKNDPTQKSLLTLRLHVHDRAGRLSDVAKDLEFLLERDDLLAQERLEDLRYLASVYLSLKRPAKARLIYGEIRRLNPQDSDAWKQIVSIALYAEKRELLPAYRDYVIKNRDARFALDVAYLLLDRKNERSLLIWLDEMQAVFPAQTRFAQLKNEILSARWWAERDLAEREIQKGNWKKAIALYEEIRKNTNPLYAVRDPLQDPLIELHRKYDHRAGVRFKLTDFGNDSLWETGLSASSWIGDSWKLETDVTFGRHHSAIGSFNGNILDARLGFQKTGIGRWTLTAGGGVGAGPERSTFSPFIAAAYEPDARRSVDIRFDLRSLRHDLPVAVAEGVLEDRGVLRGRYEFLKRLTVSGRYRLSRNTLSDGGKAWEHSFEPALAVTVSQKPFVSLGYQYTLGHVDDGSGFLARVPLIPDVRAHYLTAYLNQKILPSLTGETGVFVGEDTRRHLHLFQGDLWGANARLTWNITHRLDWEASYEYGRESFTTNTANYHQVTTFLSGHWF